MRHGLIKETAHVQVSCSCDVHRRCALGFCEDVIPRTMYVGGARQVTCANQVLHEEHHEVDTHTFLQQISRCRLVGGHDGRTRNQRKSNRSRAAAPEKDPH